MKFSPLVASADLSAGNLRDGRVLEAHLPALNGEPECRRLPCLKKEGRGSRRAHVGRSMTNRTSSVSIFQFLHRRSGATKEGRPVRAEPPSFSTGRSHRRSTGLGAARAGGPANGEDLGARPPSGLTSRPRPSFPTPSLSRMSVIVLLPWRRTLDLSKRGAVWSLRAGGRPSAESGQWVARPQTQYRW